MQFAGERAALFVGPVPEDKLPKDATFGRTLTGTLALSKLDGGKGDAPGKIQLSYRCALQARYLYQHGDPLVVAMFTAQGITWMQTTPTCAI